MSSGDLDYGTGMALGGSITGLPVKVVACFVPAPVFALVARPEVKSVQELKGKTVGISDVWWSIYFWREGYSQALRP